MNLRELFEAFDYHVSGGSQYQWNCFGPYARYLDFEIDEGKVVGSVIFDTVNQTVYQAEVWPTEGNPYRWTNPAFIDACKQEFKDNKVDWSNAFDDTKFVDLEVEKDFIEKATAIANGLEFDTRVQVPLDLDDDLLMKLFTMAHERDITLNQMVEEILTQMLERYRNE